jgi:DNA-directed RNA polymerase beta' subunit
MYLKTVKSDNPISMMAKSGTKSDLGSMAGMIGVLGQQFMGPARPPKNFSNGKRWLPLFKAEDKSIQAQGFSTKGFFEGLDVSSYFAQSQAGRVGLGDTAVRTADIGAAQRSNGKTQENLIVNYDGSVRNNKKIVQFTYGYSINPTESVKYKDKYTFIDLDEAVGRVNYKSKVKKGKKFDFSKLLK